MQWFRNPFGGKAARPAPVRPSVRPQLEALEERQLLNASTVFDSAGNKTTFIVYASAGNTPGTFNNGGNAYRIDSTGAKLIGTGVELVHGYRDANGKVGFDIVYATGYAAEFDSTGVREIGSGNNVLDVSHAIDANGNFKLDVVYADGKGQGTGNLFEYHNKGGGLVAVNVVWTTAFVDTNGVLGNAYGFGDVSSPGTVVVRDFVVDSTGTRLLGIGAEGIIGAAGVVIFTYSDYDQVTDPNGKAVIDLTSVDLSSITGGGVIGGVTTETSAAGTVSFAPNINPF